MRNTKDDDIMGNSKAYLELLESFPPVPVTSEPEAFATQEVIDALLDKEELTSAEQKYLHVLGTLLAEYEEQQDLVSDICGVELLKALIQEQELRQKDLTVVFKTESIVSAILNGQRKFTVEHIQKLAEYFNISPAAFFPSSGEMELQS